MPSITVVTPALNAAATIEETLASVRAQGYPKLEHVVVDGGSTDGTVEILGGAGVRYVSEPDQRALGRDEQGRGDDERRGDRLAERRRLSMFRAR